MIKRSYNEFKKLKTFEERFNYLKLNGIVGESTFGFDRYLNQALYKSERWKKVRREIIIRDNGCDLGIYGYEILDKIIIHHMNPITEEDILNKEEDIFNPNYLICVSDRTHNAIHFGYEYFSGSVYIERKPGDTKLW